jgi:hypothetical protein
MKEMNSIVVVVAVLTIMKRIMKKINNSFVIVIKSEENVTGLMIF